MDMLTEMKERELQLRAGAFEGRAAAPHGHWRWTGRRSGWCSAVAELPGTSMQVLERAIMTSNEGLFVNERNLLGRSF